MTFQLYLWVSMRNNVLFNFRKVLSNFVKIAFNTNNKNILKLIIKKLAFWKMHSYSYICGKFQRNDAQNVYYSSDIHNNRDTGKQFFVLPIRFLVVACNKMNFKFVQISQPATEQVLRYYCAIVCLFSEFFFVFRIFVCFQISCLFSEFSFTLNFLVTFEYI